MALRPATTARRIGAGLAPVTAASQADDRKACHPGSHHMIIRVTFDRAARRLPGTQLYWHHHPEIAKRIDIAVTAIFHQMTVDATGNLELSYAAMPGRPWDAGRMAGQAWTRVTQRP